MTEESNAIFHKVRQMMDDATPMAGYLRVVRREVEREEAHRARIDHVGESTDMIPVVKLEEVQP